MRTSRSRTSPLGLASRGVAVLRYEKRTKVHGAKSGAVADFTVKQEVVDDAVAAVRLLRAQAKIDPARVFVLGHSLGGMLVPRIAAAEPALAGVIVMAGAARPLEEAILAQTRYLAKADGTISPEEQKGIDDAAALVASVRALTPEAAKSGRMISGAPGVVLVGPARLRPAVRGEGDRGADARAAGGARLPGDDGGVRAVEGGARGRGDVTFHSYPALNHLFIAGTGPGRPGRVPGAPATSTNPSSATSPPGCQVCRGSGLQNDPWRCQVTHSEVAGTRGDQHLQGMPSVVAAEAAAAGFGPGVPFLRVEAALLRGGRARLATAPRPHERAADQIREPLASLFAILRLRAVCARVDDEDALVGHAAARDRVQPLADLGGQRRPRRRRTAAGPPSRPC